MRNTNDKRALYESIMRSVSKVVKRAINESQDGRYSIIYDTDYDTPGFTSDNLNAVIKAALDDYEEGGYDLIEIQDNQVDTIVWSTDAEPRYEVYDWNDEVIERFDAYSDAIECYNINNAKFVYDTETSDVVEGITD